MKEKVLSMIALITVFVPLTAAFVWKSDSPAATAIIIGYCIFAAVSFVYSPLYICSFPFCKNKTQGY